jgi:hypothetical protein
VPGRYFDSQGTSYEWQKYLNGLRPNFRNVTLELGDEPYTIQQPMDLNKLWMIYDFEGWHRKRPKQPKSQNILYADMHIDAE